MNGLTNDKSAEEIVRGLREVAAIIHDRGDEKVVAWLEGWVKTAADLIESLTAQLDFYKVAASNAHRDFMSIAGERDDALAQISASQQETKAAVEERRLLKRVCGGLSCLLKGIDGRMIYDKVLPMAQKTLDEYYAKYPTTAVVLDEIGHQEAGEGEKE